MFIYFQEIFLPTRLFGPTCLLEFAMKGSVMHQLMFLNLLMSTRKMRYQRIVLLWGLTDPPVTYTVDNFSTPPVKIITKV